MSTQGDKMLRKDDAFTSIVRATLAVTPIAERLRHEDAVVLERIARGGGATNWYYCRDRAEMTAIEEKLSSGSVVSFYFDGRIRHAVYSAEVAADLEAAIAKNGEVVVGALRNDGVQVDATVAVSLDDLGDFMSALAPSPELFYGAFPGRDNDGAKRLPSLFLTMMGF
jgi:hypothetical protein